MPKKFGHAGTAWSKNIAHQNYRTLVFAEVLLDKSFHIHRSTFSSETGHITLPPPHLMAGGLNALISCQSIVPVENLDHS